MVALRYSHQSLFQHATFAGTHLMKTQTLSPVSFRLMISLTLSKLSKAKRLTDEDDNSTQRQIFMSYCVIIAKFSFLFQNFPSQCFLFFFKTIPLKVFFLREKGKDKFFPCFYFNVRSPGDKVTNRPFSIGILHRN